MFSTNTNITKITREFIENNAGCYKGNLHELFSKIGNTPLYLENLEKIDLCSNHKIFFMKEYFKRFIENLKADLSHTNLSRANLSGADLSGANLYGTDYSNY